MALLSIMLLDPLCPSSQAASQQTRDPVLFQCWADVADDGPTVKKHWVTSYVYWGKKSILKK